MTFLPIQTAITTVMRDMASVLDVEDYLLLDFESWIELGRDTGRWIQTPHSKIPAPDVIILKQYGERPPRKVTFNRGNLAKRDQHTCQYCGVILPDQALTIEHVLPRSRGGPTTWENCVAACSDCNSRKADQTPPEAGMRLRSTPGQPTWAPRLAIPRGGVVRDAWRPFLAKEAAGA